MGEQDCNQLILTGHDSEAPTSGRITSRLRNRSVPGNLSMITNGPQRRVFPHLQSASRSGSARRAIYSVQIQESLVRNSEGGLSQEDVDSLAEGLSDDGEKMLRIRLNPHIDNDKPIRRQLPEFNVARLENPTPKKKPNNGSPNTKKPCQKSLGRTVNAYPELALIKVERRQARYLRCTPIGRWRKYPPVAGSRSRRASSHKRLRRVMLSFSLKNPAL